MKIPFWPKFKGYRDIDLGLDRMHAALSRLDNPHKKLPKTIHIAGTNGKGSTLAFTKSILKANGYKVHSYSSPHLVEFNERIEIANNKISDSFLNECLSRCKEACEVEPKIDLTFFEGTTLAAMLAFSEIEADFLILETGLGGRLDATNVVEEVSACIITPVDIDHSEFLGDTIEKIAAEKAGIIKDHCNVILSKQDEDAAKQILKLNNQKTNNKILQFNNDFFIKKLSNSLTFNYDFSGYYNSLKNYPTKDTLTIEIPSHLHQEHQIENLSIALATLVACDIKMDLKRINEGLSSAYWPARLEKITTGKLFDYIEKGYDSDLYLDGGHNPAAAKTVAEFFDQNIGKNVILIFSMLSDKDFSSFLEIIDEKYNHLIHCPIADSKNITKSQISNLNLSSKLLFSDSLENAIKQANTLLDGDRKNLILVCGSLYLAGEFHCINQTPL